MTALTYPELRELGPARAKRDAELIRMTVGASREPEVARLGAIMNAYREGFRTLIETESRLAKFIGPEAAAKWADTLKRSVKV